MESRMWLRLQNLQFFLIILFHQISMNGRFSAVAQTEGEEFLQLKEKQVQAIAAGAVQNYADTSCGLVANCTASQCSRAACFRLLEDVQNYQCVNVTSNANCTCNSLQANFQRSYVRVPFFGDGGNSITGDRTSSICTQRGLDNIFRGFRSDDDGNYYNYYFGSVDGTFRFYPGTEVADCNGYDPRARPWYLGAISVVKDLVVLVDVSVSMGDPFGFFSITTPLASALNMTQQLLGTLTVGDRATVISYDNAASLVGQSYTVENGSFKLDTGFLELQRLVSNTSVTEMKSSNATAAISDALLVLGTGSPDGALKVIVLFTDGLSPVPQQGLDTLVAQLNNAGIVLFIYQINGVHSSFSDLACTVTVGYNEQLSGNPLQNPMYALKSYFSWLARNRQSVGPQLAFWQQPYMDFGFLGQVITVGYPAISPTGELVGVAGIDIQVSGISIPKQAEIFTALKSRTIIPPRNASGARFATCNAGFNDGSTSCATSSAIPLCKQTDKENTYQELLCCPGCGGLEPRPKSKSSKNLTPLWIGLGSLGGVVILVLAIFVVKRKPWATGLPRAISPSPKPNPAQPETDRPAPVPVKDFRF